MGSKDSWLGFSVSKKSIREHITPHKISVVLLIQEYCIIKFEGKLFTIIEIYCYNMYLLLPKHIFKRFHSENFKWRESSFGFSIWAKVILPSRMKLLLSFTSSRMFCPFSPPRRLTFMVYWYVERIRVPLDTRSSYIFTEDLLLLIMPRTVTLSGQNWEPIPSLETWCFPV